MSGLAAPPGPTEGAAAGTPPAFFALAGCQKATSASRRPEAAAGRSLAAATNHLLGRILAKATEVAADAVLEGINVGKLARHIVVRFFRIEIEVVKVSVGEALQDARETAGAGRAAILVARHVQQHLVLTAPQSRKRVDQPIVVILAIGKAVRCQQE